MMQVFLEGPWSVSEVGGGQDLWVLVCWAAHLRLGGLLVWMAGVGLSGGRLPLLPCAGVWRVLAANAAQPSA